LNGGSAGRNLLVRAGNSREKIEIHLGHDRKDITTISFPLFPISGPPGSDWFYDIRTSDVTSPGLRWQVRLLDQENPGDHQRSIGHEKTDRKLTWSVFHCFLLMASWRGEISSHSIIWKVALRV
jgi:hypothetical protein